MLPKVGIYLHCGDFEGFGGDHFFQVGIEIFKNCWRFLKKVGNFCKMLGFFSKFFGFFEKGGEI